MQNPQLVGMNEIVLVLITYILFPGDLRFRAPAPPANVSGQGVQQASVDGPRCLQTSNGRAPSSPFPLNSTTLGKRSALADSEDCLYLK